MPGTRGFCFRVRGHRGPSGAILLFPAEEWREDRGRNARWTLGPGCLRPPPRQPRGGTRKSVRDRRGSPKFPSLGLGSALPRRRDEAPLSLCSPPVRRGVTSPPHGLGRRPLLLRPSTRAAANSNNFLILTNYLFKNILTAFNYCRPLLCPQAAPSVASRARRADSLLSALQQTTPPPSWKSPCVPPTPSPQGGPGCAADSPILSGAHSQAGSPWG